jgi:hypothetical protein
MTVPRWSRRRIGTADAYEGTVLAVDHSTSSEVEPGNLIPVHTVSECWYMP